MPAQLFRKINQSIKTKRQSFANGDNSTKSYIKSPEEEGGNS
jgi:hypothetical protein